MSKTDTCVRCGRTGHNSAACTVLPAAVGCSECATAHSRPLYGGYRNGCTECAARRIAQSQDAFFSAAAGAATPGMRSALQQAFGAQWKHGLARVKFWADKIRGTA
jgi:hypothetical protein